MIKKIMIFFIMTILIAIVPLNVFADYGGMDTNINIGSTGAITSSVPITNRIVGTLQVVGTIISVVALIIIGMRYMFSSVEDKASMKGVLIYYIIGAVLVFATSNILGIAYDVITGLDKTGGSSLSSSSSSGSQGGGITVKPSNPQMTTK